MIKRRKFIANTMSLAALSAIIPDWLKEIKFKQKTVLLCSSWQTFNIGDIAHTPGVLAILEKQLPDVNVILWPHDVRNGVKEILQKRFPRYKIVESEEEVSQAFRQADFLLHGSG